MRENKSSAIARVNRVFADKPGGLASEDFERGKLPPILEGYLDKIFGLTIKSERLHSLRSERRPDSTYASLSNCRHEIGQAEDLMKKVGIPTADSTSKSVEELSAIIIQFMKH